MRKQSQRAQAWTSMTTEYRERFAPPRRYMAATPPKGPDHPLKASSTHLPAAESCYVTHKWIKGPSVPPKRRQQTRSSAPREPVWSVECQQGSKVEDYTSVYQDEFRAWKANRQHPFKLTDCLRVSQGLVVPDCAAAAGARRGSVQDAAESKAVPRPPFVSITSYRSDYVSHPAQPRGRREKVTRGVHQLLFHEANEFPQRPETSFHSQVNAGGSSPPADHTFLSAADADNTAHQCHCTKPLLPPVQTGEREKKPFEATTTTKEDYKA